MAALVAHRSNGRQKPQDKAYSYLLVVHNHLCHLHSKQCVACSCGNAMQPQLMHQFNLAYAFKTLLA